MLLTIKLSNRNMAMTAPLGAAAFSLEEDTTAHTARITFAMMQNVAGYPERGIDTINRVRREFPTMKWKCVTARPEEQVASGFGPDKFIEYAFAYKDGAWSPTTEALANFMRATRAIRDMPLAAPSELGVALGTPGSEIAGTRTKRK